LTGAERPFSFLNVRSVIGDDLTTRARIRDSAIRRFGVDGFGVPVRTIAQGAGVSPALVIHHFGTKDALRAACDEHVLRQIGEAETDSVVRGSPGDMLAQLAAVEQYAPLTGYVVQALLAGGDLSRAFLERLVHDTELYLQEAVEAGRVRPSRDPVARARYLVYLGIGALLVHLRLHPPTDGDLGPALRSYADAVALPALELYTDGLLADRTMLDAYLDSVPAPAGGDLSPL
jgi:TetR/AcrR family transcriptional regulator, regulator of cefoperazone and chloramphenicol sensitivity